MYSCEVNQVASPGPYITYLDICRRHRLGSATSQPLSRARFENYRSHGEYCYVISFGTGHVNKEYHYTCDTFVFA